MFKGPNCLSPFPRVGSNGVLHYVEMSDHQFLGRINGIVDRGNWLGKLGYGWLFSSSRTLAFLRNRIPSFPALVLVVVEDTWLCRASFVVVPTVGMVAEQLGLSWIGIELNTEYAEIAKKRIGDQEKITQHIV